MANNGEAQRWPLLDSFITYYDFGPAWEPGQPSVYFQSQLHGNEAAGTAVLRELVNALRTLPAESICGAIRIVPRANPFAWQSYVQTRQGTYDLTTGENWNRIYDWSALREEAETQWKGMSEDDAWKLMRRLVAQRREASYDLLDQLRYSLFELASGYAYIIDVHTPDNGIEHLYCSRYSETVPHFGVPNVLEFGDPQGNTFDEGYLRLIQQAEGHLGHSQAITLEIKNRLALHNDQVEDWVERILNELRHRRILQDVEDVEMPRPAYVGSYVSCIGRVTGIVVYHRRPGEFVKAGDVVGELIPFDMEDAPQQVTAPVSGILLNMRDQTIVPSGGWVVRMLHPHSTQASTSVAG